MKKVPSRPRRPRAKGASGTAAPKPNAAVSEDHIATVRHFNRLYTQQIGVLNRGFLDSEFSLTEVRVLYELRHREQTTATALGQELALDAGYLSRILRSFEQKGLLVREPSTADGRQTLLRLSKKGRDVFDLVEARQRSAVADMLMRLSPQDQQRLVASLRHVERLLVGRPEPSVPYILRPLQPGDIGWIAHRQGVLYNQEFGWDEQFEALVAQIAATFVQELDPKRERCWIAEREGEIVGSVFCVKQSKTVARLRLLYVEPSARHLGIGTRLVDECIAFARRTGYRKLTLWTNSVLDAARRIYERAGFQLMGEERHHSFGHDLVAQTWEMEL